jgi:hypothetical protein
VRGPPLRTHGEPPTPAPTVSTCGEGYSGRSLSTDAGFALRSSQNNQSRGRPLGRPQGAPLTFRYVPRCTGDSRGRLIQAKPLVHRRPTSAHPSRAASAARRISLKRRIKWSSRNDRPRLQRAYSSPNSPKSRPHCGFAHPSPSKPVTLCHGRPPAAGETGAILVVAPVPGGLPHGSMSSQTGTL